MKERVSGGGGLGGRTSNELVSSFDVHPLSHFHAFVVFIVAIFVYDLNIRELSGGSIVGASISHRRFSWCFVLVTRLGAEEGGKG